MGSLVNYNEDRLLDMALGNGTPATLYLGLSTADPTDDMSGLAEPSGGSYARVSITNNATNFPASSGGAKSNGTAFDFPTATASWGLCTHWFLSDASSAGNYHWHGSLTSSITVDSGETVSFAIDDLDFTMD